MIIVARPNMEIRVQSSTIIPQPNPDAEPVETPLTVFDRFASDIHIAVLFAFAPPTPPNWVIVEGLIKTLAHFPTLTGRLGRSTRGDRKGRPCLLVGGSGGGALLVEATVASKLSDHLPLEPHPDFQFLQPPCDGMGDQAPPQLLQVQLNRFECGGIIVGVTAHHRVADGHSMSTFFVAWGQTLRNLPVDPLPSYDQSSWLTPRRPPRCHVDHFEYEFMPRPPRLNRFPPSRTEVDPDTITNLLLHYSHNYIATELKPATRNKFSTFEILLAHVWRKITIARRLDGNVSTMIRVSVNGRSRLNRNVPKEFFGNLVLNAYPNANVKKLVEGGLDEAGRVVHEAVVAIDGEYFESFIDFGAVNEGEELVPVYDSDANVLSPNLEVDSLLRFRFQELDFGGGSALCAFLPTWVPVDGLMVFLPSLRADGGVDVFLGLREEHAKVLRQISHSLD